MSLFIGFLQLIRIISIINFSTFSFGVIEISLFHRCKCTHCSLEYITKREECFCCHDIDRCQEKIQKLVESGNEEPLDCITLHPGFVSGCLDEWVLEIAAIGLKTKKNKRYTVLYHRHLDDKNK